MCAKLYFLLFMDFFFWKNIQGRRLGRNIKPKPWQSRNLQLIKQKYYEGNKTSTTIVTDEGWEQGVGTGGEGGVLQMKTAGCLLYILLLTTRCFYYLWD